MGWNKILKRFLTVIVFLFLVLVLLWYGINNFLIPRVILPWAKASITQMGEQYRFAIGGIEFHPYKGFLVKNFDLFFPKSTKIFSVEEVDLDLNYWQLLSKRLKITNFKVYGACLVVARDKKGRWNFEALLDSDIKKLMENQGLALVIKEIDFYDSKIDYSDSSKPGKAFTRSFFDVDLFVKNPSENRYLVQFSGGKNNKENLVLNLDYNHSQKSVSGKVQIQTDYFNGYKDYYLEQYFTQGQFEIGSLAGGCSFVYKNKDLSLNGKVRIDDAKGKYGDSILTGGGEINFKLEFEKWKLKPGRTVVNVDGYDLSMFFGKHQIFEQGEVSLFADTQNIVIREFTGKQVRNNFNLKGFFSYPPYSNLSLSGEAFGMNNIFRLGMLPPDCANLDWKMYTERSSLEFLGVVTDMKDLDFSLKLDGVLDLSEWRKGFNIHVGKPALVSMEVTVDKMKGKVTLDGRLFGEADKTDSWSGNLNVLFSGFSVYGLEIGDFPLNVSVQEGLFQAVIPTIEFYKGTILGLLKLDVKRWGAELDVKNADLAYLYKTSPKFKDLKGEFSGKVVLVGNWGNKNSIVGGGYLDLKHCDLKKAPLFEDAEEGIGKVVKDFSMPNFEKIEGNFDVKNQQLLFNNVFCKASNLSICLSGTCGFDGNLSATAGVRMFGGFFKTLRQIILPVTIGFDLVANSIQINIKGKIPDVSQTTEVMPMNWLGAFYNLNYKADPNRYSLGTLW
ncbi:MAG: AsmA family protein [Candidatus Saganbacteria bacterium]|nr:AsmA family protein [Candidatus Saganbacteria bacterium]